MLPYPLCVMDAWSRMPTGGYTSTYQKYFLERGGSVEVALAYVIDKASHVDAAGGFRDLDPAAQSAEGATPPATSAADNRRRIVDSFLALPKRDTVPAEVCANDTNFDAVFEAVVGPCKAFGRRLAGCEGCGWLDSDEDYNSKGWPRVDVPLPRVQ
jgi:hypothetical protein